MIFLPSSGIKSCFPLLAFVLLAPIGATAGEFTRTLTTEDLRITGLAKLTPGELAALNVRIEEYKDGTAAPTSAKTAPPAKVVAAPTTMPDARSDKHLPDWVGALITLKRAETNVAKPQTLESRLVGDFGGWKGHTSFKLENGQVWTQANDDSFVYSPPVKAPKVKIYPGTFGTFWMEIEGVRVKCRIRPVNLE